MDAESETLIPTTGGGFDVAHSLRADGFDASEDGTGRGTPLVAFSCKDHGADAGQLAPTLRAMGHSGSHANAGGQLAVASPSVQVRRLTVKECERLMGFPDDYTLIQYRNKPAADGPRYKALGNSMAVPCMHWIGKRIQRVNEIGGEQ
jgi:DNA (cytosine-5)-methyltransferase 1